MDLPLRERVPETRPRRPRPRNPQAPPPPGLPHPVSSPAHTSRSYGKQSLCVGRQGPPRGLPRPVPEVLGLPRSAIATSGQRRRFAGLGPSQPALRARLSLSPTSLVAAQWRR